MAEAKNDKSLDLSKFPFKNLVWTLFVSIINPRQWLNWKKLLPAIVEAGGHILEPVVVWLPDPNDPFVKAHNLKPNQVVIIRGHRRLECIRHIRNNPALFTAEVFTNAEHVPAVVLTGITEEKARDLALDDQDQERLKDFEVVSEVLRRYESDQSYQEVCDLMYRGLYRTMLRTKGEAALQKMLEITEGTERRKKMLSDLRNGMDQWLYSAHLLGPAIREQAILWTMRERDGVKSEDLPAQQYFYAKLANLRELRSVFNNTRDSGWEPITQIGIREDGELFVKGGNKDVEAKLKQYMEEFRNPEAAKKDKPKRPTEKECEDVASTIVSTVGKLTAAYYCGKETEGRAEEDGKAHLREKKDAALAEILKSLPEPIKSLAKVCLEEKNIEKFKEAWKSFPDNGKKK